MQTPIRSGGVIYYPRLEIIFTDTLPLKVAHRKVFVCVCIFPYTGKQCILSKMEKSGNSKITSIGNTLNELNSI